MRILFLHGRWTRRTLRGGSSRGEGPVLCQYLTFFSRASLEQAQEPQHGLDPGNRTKNCRGILFRHGNQPYMKLSSTDTRLSNRSSNTHPSFSPDYSSQTDGVNDRASSPLRVFLFWSAVDCHHRRESTPTGPLICSGISLFLA